MRIVLVVPGGVDPPGGERVIPFLHDLIERLGADHRLRVVAVGHDPQPGEWRLFDAEVVNVPVGRHGKADIARVVREVSAIAGGGARGTRPDVVHGFWATLPGLAAVAAARRHRIPSVLSLAGGELADLPDIDYGGGRRRGTKAMATTSIRLASVVTAATEWMRDHAVAAGGRVDEVVPLGVDPLRWHPADPSTRVTPTRLVHIGSANRVKDQAMLLHALRLALADEPDLHLDLVGVDTLDGAHDRLIERLGLTEHVRRHGPVDRRLLPDLVRGCGLHVVSSRHEAGPVAVLEAGACGVPTVGTRVGHVADLAALTHPAALAVDRRLGSASTGSAGVDATATATETALAAAIVTLVRDDALRSTLADRARAWSLAHDADHTARSFEAVHRRLAR